MPIDSLRPFRDRWSRPKGFTQCQVISEDEYKSIPNPKENTIYLMGDEKTGYTPACVGNWHNNSSSTSEPLKKITPDQLINNQLPPYFLDIAQRCGYTQLDAYYWENPYENFTNNLEINIAREGSLSFIESYKWYADDLKYLKILISKIFNITFNFSEYSSDSSKKKYTGLDGAIFVFFINLLGFVHFILRSIPGLFDILFEKAERAFAEKSAPLWDKNKGGWFLYAIPRGFFFLLKQPFKLAETAISTVFQTIDITLILAYSVTNIICGGFRPAKWKESWRLVKESLPRLYSITLVRGFFIGLIGALAFFAPEILAFLGIGTAAGVAVLAVTGTAITATPKVLDEASEHCCPSSHNTINHKLEEKKVAVEEKTTKVTTENDVKISPIITNNFQKINITLDTKQEPIKKTIGELTLDSKCAQVQYTPKKLTKEEREKFEINGETYNRIFLPSMLNGSVDVFESLLSKDETTSADEAVLAYYPANDWCLMMYCTASIHKINDANFIMDAFFRACNKRHDILLKSAPLTNGYNYIIEALYLILFLHHLSAMLSASDAEPIKNILDTDAEPIKNILDTDSKTNNSIVNIYKNMQNKYNKKKETTLALKENLIQIFDTVKRIKSDFNFDWNKVTLEIAEQKQDNNNISDSSNMHNTFNLPYVKNENNIIIPDTSTPTNSLPKSRSTLSLVK